MHKNKGCSPEMMTIQRQASLIRKLREHLEDMVGWAEDELGAMREKGIGNPEGYFAQSTKAAREVLDSQIYVSVSYMGWALPVPQEYKEEKK